MTDRANRRLGRTLLISVVLGAGCLTAAAWCYFLRQSAALEATVGRELAAIAEVKAIQIASWRQERIGDGKALEAAPVLQLARRIVEGRASETDLVALLDVLSRVTSVFQYGGAVVTDSSGITLLKVGDPHPDPVRFRNLAAQASAVGRVVLSDLYLANGSGSPWMSLTVPVPGGGAIILDIDPRTFLFPFVQSWPTASRTAETLLMRREGDQVLYLNELRHRPGTALRLRRTLPDRTLPGEPGFVEGRVSRRSDYRNVPVMGVAHEIPGSNWYLRAKIDVAEVEGPLRRLGWEMAFVVVLIVAANAAVAGFIWKGRQLKVQRIRENWFRQIANDTPPYLWTTSPTGENTFINRQCAAFLGTSRESLGSAWLDYVHPEDRERALQTFRASLTIGSPYQDEFRVRRFDGAYRWTVLQGLPQNAPDGKFAGYAGSLTDVTDRHEAEQGLRDANQALAAELRERTRTEREIHALSARLINAQEEERTRLAREMHDDLSQQIAAISIASSSLKKKIPAGAPEAIAQTVLMQQRLAQLAEHVRRLSHELHPSVLQHSGLAAALRDYCSEYAALTSHSIVFRGEGACEEVPPAAALCAYRVAQEGLQNSIKHSGVREVEVLLACSPESLCVTVSDHGAGMDPAAAGAKGGLGLVSIRERARLVNGSLEILSRPGEGTTLRLTIPLSPPSPPDDTQPAM